MVPRPPGSTLDRSSAASDVYKRQVYLEPAFAAAFAAAVEEARQAKIAILMLPGLGTLHDLKNAHAAGASVARIATHCTEADVSEQHITLARKLDLDTVGFLRMAHMTSAEGMVKQALLRESYGANCIYITDSAGTMLPDDVKTRLGAVRAALKPDSELGFHGHHNLAMGVATSLAAIQSGANRIHAAAAGPRPGTGNTPVAVFLVQAARRGCAT
mgnify:CR=1 FL=1